MVYAGMVLSLASPQHYIFTADSASFALLSIHDFYIFYGNTIALPELVLS